MTHVLRWCVKGLAFLLGIWGFALCYSALRSSDHFWLGLAFAVCGWFPVVLIHELGHALAAWLGGWRVLIFHVAPFAIWSKPLAIRFVGDMGGPDIAGFVLPFPGRVGVDTWLRSVLISAGGPLASWFFAFSCFGAVAAFRLDEGAPLTAYAGTLGSYSLAMALLSTWPMPENGGANNDAAKILATWRSRSTLGLPGTAPRWAQALWRYNIPMQAFDQWMIDALKHSYNVPSVGADAMLTGVLDALLHGDDTAVRKACDLLRGLHPHSQEAGLAEAFAAAWLDRDVTSADAILPKIQVNAKDDKYRLRQLTLAWIHRLENQIEAAERVLEDLMQSAGATYRFSGPAWERLTRQVFVRPLHSQLTR